MNIHFNYIFWNVRLEREIEFSPIFIFQNLTETLSVQFQEKLLWNHVFSWNTNFWDFMVQLNPEFECHWKTCANNIDMHKILGIYKFMSLPTLNAHKNKWFRRNQYNFLIKLYTQRKQGPNTSPCIPKQAEKKKEKKQGSRK